MLVTIAVMMSGCRNTASLLTRYALIQLVLLVGNSIWSIWTERQVQNEQTKKPDIEKQNRRIVRTRKQL